MLRSVSFFCFLILCLNCFGTSQYAKRYNNQQRNCGSDSFRCTSGQCIDDHMRCDGKADCSDNSDETRQLCSNLNCPPYAYRCDYGGCVNQRSRCNGVTDCLDGSDETTCDTDTAMDQQVVSSLVDFVCSSGQRINEHMRCDGKADCQDQSDETEKLCLNINCPPYAYRCEYGGCVNQRSRCNGIEDCLDGSDEILCRGTMGLATTRKPSQSPTPIKCGVPNNPENGMYTIADRSPDSYRVGSSVPPFSVLITNCDQGYHMATPAAQYSVCANGIWTPIPSTCSSFASVLNPSNPVKCECHC